MSELKKLKKSSKSAELAKQQSVMEWPTFLDDNIMDVIKNDFKFSSMTPVQSVVIPIFSQQHKDVVVEAVTGSGKTLAYVIPVLEILKRCKRKFNKHDITALIISPTRELAKQIHDHVEMFLQKITNLTCILFVGGTTVAEDLKNFQQNGGNIIVGTAGRLEDIFSRSNLKLNMKNNLKNFEVLILDEADRLLELGFRENLQTIFDLLPKQRRTGLFSATQTDEIDKLIKVGLRNPCFIQVKQKGNALAQKTPLKLNNYYMIVEPNEKFFRLLTFLKEKKSEKHLVFMSTCACVQYFTKLLKHFIKDVKILCLHRKLKDKRNKIYDEFKKLDTGILLCTDILSRGIDIDNVDWVVQYDPPKTATSFVHRCGRTARLDRNGDALIFLLPNEDAYVNFMLLNQRVPIEEFSEDIFSKKNLDITIKKIQTLASKERELYEKGKLAFVSYIRAYTKHECSHIFRTNELDYVKLAQGFGLLHLPKMPEIKLGLEYKPFVQIEISKIEYKDKVKEKERQQMIAERKENGFQKDRKKLNVSWSNKKEKKLKRKIKREKSQIVEKKRKNESIDEDDYNEIQKDFSLLKKLKKRKISEKEYESKTEENVS